MTGSEICPHSLMILSVNSVCCMAVICPTLINIVTVLYSGGRGRACQNVIHRYVLWNWGSNIRTVSFR